MTPTQDDALSLSRLAEYFVEMDRREPAGLAVKVLAGSFPDDPNAAIARGIFLAHIRDKAGLDRELSKLSADVTNGIAPTSWDRRVQRMIVLALGNRHALAKAEATACIASVSKELLFGLTPLQAYRLNMLLRGYGISVPDPSTTQLLSRLGAEYSPANANR